MGDDQQVFAGGVEVDRRTKSFCILDIMPRSELSERLLSGKGLLAFIRSGILHWKRLYRQACAERVFAKREKRWYQSATRNITRA